MRGYWSEYGAWSVWQDSPVTPSSSRQVETDNYVIDGYNKKTQWFYSRYYGLHSDGFYRALSYSSGVCRTYEDTGWLDAPLPWETYTNRYGETYEGWGFNSDGKQIFWYNEQTREVDDTSSPIYKTQYRYRERYIIYY